MNRKGFITAVAALFTAPFVKEEKPEPTLPKNRPVEVANMTVSIKGEDLWVIQRNYQNRRIS